MSRRGVHGAAGQPVGDASGGSVGNDRDALELEAKDEHGDGMSGLVQGDIVKLRLAATVGRCNLVDEIIKDKRS